MNNSYGSGYWNHGPHFNTCQSPGYRINFRDQSCEEMDWSDSCLDTSNNNLSLSSSFPSLSSRSLSHFSAARLKGHGTVLPEAASLNRSHTNTTSPSSLLSTLNISEGRGLQLNASKFSLMSPRAKTIPSGFPLISATHSASKQSTFPASQKFSSSSSFPAFRRCAEFPSSATPSTFDEEIFPSDPVGRNNEGSIFGPETRNLDAETIEDETYWHEDNHCVSNNEDDLKWNEEDDTETYLETADTEIPAKRKGSCFCRLMVFTALSVLLVGLMIHVWYPTLNVCDLQMDSSGVQSELNRKVFGQNLAVEVVAENLGSFLQGTSNQKNLLVLSFQGWTGIGKNHMTNVLVRFLPFSAVHRFIVTLHMTRNSEPDIENWFMSKITSKCGTHLFILDEMDKASEDLVSRLQHTLMAAEEFLLKQENTRAVVLLLSNTGSTAINTFTAEVLKNGLTRQNVSYSGLVDRLKTSVPSAWYKEMMEKNLIDRVVPFLPLEKIHVVKCIKAALEARSKEPSDDIITAVLDQLTFFPPSNGIFSTTGCRKVNSQLDLLLY